MTTSRHFKTAIGILLTTLAVHPCFSENSSSSDRLIDTDSAEVVLKAGDPSLKKWMLPEKPPAPKDNQPTPERVELGKKLFFDPRLSRDENQSCASCHNPSFGWGDAISKAIGFKSKPMTRNTPSLVNSAYNAALLWDGRKDTLDEQAMGPVTAEGIMNADLDKLLTLLKSDSMYQKAFKSAYSNEPINKTTVAKALASFERTLIVRDTPFDRWVQGDAKAMSEQQIRGFRLFIDPKKGNCAACHSAPNFTDDGFHNIGLSSFAAKEPDMGRFKHVKIPVLKGAFKTPPLRDVARTAPYFHDGSAKDLMAVIEHYNKGGVVKENISKLIKPLNLSKSEEEDLVAFLNALTGPYQAVTIPNLTDN